jgi:hypothetical protein
MKQESLTGSPEERRWPFAETPGEFTNRLASAYNAFGTLLAAVRYVLIEEPPTFDAAASPPPPAEPALPELTDEQIKQLFYEASPGPEGLIAFARAIEQELRPPTADMRNAACGVHGPIPCAGATCICSAAAPSGPPVAEMRQPVAWRFRFHTDDSLAGKPNVRPWVLIDKEPQSHEDIEVEPLFASSEPLVEAPSPEEIELLTRIDEDFADCEETDVDYFAMLNLARRGFLECERFVITEKGAKVIYEESNGVAPTRGGEHGE